MTLKAGVVVTGTEVLSGIRRDRNGPWLAARLRELGAEPAHIVVCGDRPEEIAAALSFLAAQGSALIVTSGGLGPTADDLTAEVVGRFQGRPLVLDRALEAQIGKIVAAIGARYPKTRAAALAAGTRKQAQVPQGAEVLRPRGTAPGFLVPPRGGKEPLVVVLPGPPRELQPMFEEALRRAPLAALLARARPRRVAVMRLFGIPESELTAALAEAPAAGVELTDLEITTCLHRGELEVTTAFAPAAEEAYQAFQRYLYATYPEALFAPEGQTIDQLVADLLRACGETIATAESCTGGLLAARITDLPGSSAYFKGSLVTYANSAKTELAGVQAAVIEAHGAVSRAVAEALAEGACRRLGATVGVGVSGIAGPEGGTPEKPVGLVWFAVHRVGRGTVSRSLQLPGGRGEVRERATTVALHLVRTVLAQGQAPPRPLPCG